MKKIICFLLVMMIALSCGCKLLDGETTSGSDLDGVESTKSPKNGGDDEYIETTPNSDFANEQGTEISKDTDISNEFIRVTAYYRDGDNTLIPLTRKIKKEEGIARATLNYMIDNEQNNSKIKDLGLQGILPKDTTMLGINIKDDIAIVDFSSDILDYTSEATETNIVAGVVYCLTGFDTIEGVKFLIEGKEYGKMKFGTDISEVLGRQNTLINSHNTNLGDKVSKIDIYLYKYMEGKREYILPVSVSYIGIEEDMLPTELVRMLTEKPKDGKLYSQIPTETRLISSRIDKDILVLDFDREIGNYGGSSRELGILNQLIYTMKQINKAKGIKILIEGREGTLPEGTDLSKEIIFPAHINAHDDI